MSRYYRNETIIYFLDNEIKSGDLELAKHIYETFWNIDNVKIYENLSFTSIISLSGESSLCSGESEEEAHLRFTKAFREVFPECGVDTYWTYLEDLPTNSYFTDVEEEIS